MQTLSEIRALLERHGLRPQHRFGQNFLHDRRQLARLVDAAGVRPGETILEVGPGTGTLTTALLEAGARVVACEIDAGLVRLLADHLQPQYPDRLTIVAGDVLAGKRSLCPAVLDALGPGEFKLVANLPYNIATPLVGILLTRHTRPGATPRCLGQWITVQREVADRFAASPGTKDYGPISVLAQALADVRRIATLSPASFWPAPKVTSAMVAIEPRATMPDIDLERLNDVLQRLFQQRRKQLGSLLGRDFPWPEGVVAQMRPEALTIEQWLELARRA